MSAYVVKFMTMDNKPNSFLEEHKRPFKSFQKAFIFQKQLRDAPINTYRVMGIPVIERQD